MSSHVIIKCEGCDREERCNTDEARRAMMQHIRSPFIGIMADDVALLARDDPRNPYRLAP